MKFGTSPMGTSSLRMSRLELSWGKRFAPWPVRLDVIERAGEAFTL
jgi:hypothetical protein